MRFLLWFILIVAPIAQAIPLKGTASFHATSIGGLMNIDGVGGIVGGDSDTIITVDLAHLDTDNDLRNEHMRDKYLEVAKFPKASLKLDPVKAGPKFEWSGKLTIKGDTKPVKGSAELNGSDLSAHFTILLADFPSIGAPNWKGVGVSNEVKIEVKAKAQ